MNHQLFGRRPVRGQNRGQIRGQSGSQIRGQTRVHVRGQSAKLFNGKILFKGKTNRYFLNALYLVGWVTSQKLNKCHVSRLCNGHIKLVISTIFLLKYRKIQGQIDKMLVYMKYISALF